MPGFGWHGVECAGLTALPGGGVLLNQWRFAGTRCRLARSSPADGRRSPCPTDWRAGDLAGSPELDERRASSAEPERLVPWARGGGET